MYLGMVKASLAQILCSDGYKKEAIANLVKKRKRTATGYISKSE
ncbi:1208_t:CDS:1, partial [Dentiscutata heterogama]